MNKMRNWNNIKDNASTAALGNGDMIVFTQGLDIVKMYGPPYSTQSYISLKTNFDGELNAIGNRVLNTAIWEHEIKSGNKKIASMTEFVDSKLPVFIREFDTKQDGMSFTINYEHEVKLLTSSDQVRGVHAITEPGQRTLSYIFIEWGFQWIIPFGSFAVEIV